MKNLKTFLLGAAAVSSLCSTGAQAQVVVSAPLAGSELKGAGASSVESLVVEAFNCIGADVQLGKGATNTPSTTVAPTSGYTTIPAGNYAPTSPTASNPARNCAASNDIQPNFTGKYVSTGSGFGRSLWSTFANQFYPANATLSSSANENPFVTISGQPAWTNVQFAFTDAPISSGELATYNTNANSTTNLAGRAIQIPLYVLPVALAYDTRYGTKGGVDLNFNAPTGGIKLNQSQYCSIFNGFVTNWNQVYPATTGTNAILDTTNDTPARWTQDGVPIRLVGRSDSSGTTNIFTRHLNAVCGTTGNKFTGASNTLPATATSTATYAAGVLSGTEVAGRFALAAGSGQVAAALAAAPDVASANDATTLLNGRFGYISADFVQSPTTATPSLRAAQLTQIGSTTAFKTPTTANAIAAFATIVPPQSTSSGSYNANDLRKNSATLLPVNRANPLDWADVLYSRADLNGGFTARTLAAPAAGYPITGTTFLLTSTCFKSDANRYALTTFLYGQLKKLNRTGFAAPNDKLSTNFFSGTGNTAKGLTTQSNLAPLSPAWQKAIYDTFLTKATGALGARGLFIQSKLPTTTLTGITGNTGGTDSNVGGVAQAACTANAGA